MLLLLFSQLPYAIRATYFFMCMGRIRPRIIPARCITLQIYLIPSMYIIAVNTAHGIVERNDVLPGIEPVWITLNFKTTIISCSNSVLSSWSCKIIEQVRFHLCHLIIVATKY